MNRIESFSDTAVIACILIAAAICACATNPTPTQNVRYCAPYNNALLVDTTTFDEADFAAMANDQCLELCHRDEYGNLLETPNPIPGCP